MKCLRRFLVFPALAFTAAVFAIEPAQPAAPVSAAPAVTAAPGAEVRRFTFLFVHGAWAGGWHFRKIDPLLTAHGHQVHRPTLTGLGERVHLATPAINLSTHVDDIVNTILWEDLRDIILVGHSYGGMVVAGVMDRVPDRLRQVIFLDAVVPDDGESMNAAFSVPETEVKGDFIVPGWVKPDKPIPHDVPHPSQTLREPVSFKNPAALKLPATFVLYVEAGKKPEEARFHRFYQRAQSRGWTVRTMEANHNPQWFKPAELAALLEEIARHQP